MELSYAWEYQNEHQSVSSFKVSCGIRCSLGENRSLVLFLYLASLSYEENLIHSVSLTSSFFFVFPCLDMDINTYMFMYKWFMNAADKVNLLFLDSFP